MKPSLVFSIKTIPDVAGLRLLHALPAALGDAEVAEFVFQKGRAAYDASQAPDSLPNHLHCVVSIAGVLRDDNGVRVVSFADSDCGEEQLIRSFFDFIGGAGQLISWDGSRFDMPTLLLRALVHGLSARTYWARAESSDGEPMIDLAARFADSGANLADVATLCGFPGKPRLRGRQVWDAWRAGNAEAVSACCQVEALNCYLVYLRFQLTRGVLDITQYAEEIQAARTTLTELKALHWREYLVGWPGLSA